MIETPRLLIQPWKNSDVEAFFQLTQDPGFNLYPITDWKQKNLESAQRWISENNELFVKTRTGAFAVRERSAQVLIGLAALRCLNLENESRFEITYRLRESVWGQGFAIEIARALIRYGFVELRLDEIAASITPDNIPSKKIIQKVGMKFTGTEIMSGVAAEIFRIQQQDFNQADGNNISGL